MAKIKLEIESALIQDAKRYRWLRDNCAVGEEAPCNRIDVQLGFMRQVTDLVQKWPNAVDIAIDAAMAESVSVPTTE